MFFVVGGIREVIHSDPCEQILYNELLPLDTTVPLGLWQSFC